MQCSFLSDKRSNEGPPGLVNGGTKLFVGTIYEFFISFRAFNSK